MSPQSKVAPGDPEDKLDLVLREHHGDVASTQRERAQITFDLHGEPRLEQAHDVRRVSVFPQDPFVSEPVLRTIPAFEMPEGLSSTRFRVRVRDGRIALPDKNGDYLFRPQQRYFDQINALYYAMLTLRISERYAGRPLPWSFGRPQLIIDPHAGNTQANAYYSPKEQSINFFSFLIKRRVVKAAQSADVVSHETGHAILDGLRDLINTSFSFGPETFHESFGDMIAILVALHDNGLVNRLLQITNGDLRVPSFLTHLSEELGKTLHAIDKDPRNDQIFYIRNAINTFKAARFEDLPYLPEDPITMLGREAHSYSRVMTGALYNILVSVYETEKMRWSPQVAVALARDVVGVLLVRAVELGPIGEASLEDYAWSMLEADRLFMNGRNEDIIRQEFLNRGLLTQAEMKGRVEARRKVPALKLDPGVTDATTALEFLNQNRKALGLPDDLDFFTQLGYRDREGNRFITYFTSETIQLSGRGFGPYQNTSLPLFGGVAMLFDPKGKLLHTLYRPVTEEDRNQALQQVKDMVKHGHIAFGFSDILDEDGIYEPRTIATWGSQSSSEEDLYQDVDPTFQPSEESGQMRQADVARDVVRLSVQGVEAVGIREYLNAWQDKIAEEKPGNTKIVM